MHKTLSKRALLSVHHESNAQFEHQVWYVDSGANAHITSNAQNLSH